MKRIEICCPDCFAHNLIDAFETIHSDYPMLSVYGDYKIIKPIFESLIRYGLDIDLGVELEDYNCSGYTKEYNLCISKNGVSVEKLWHETDTYSGYYGSEPDIAFVHEDCNSAILKHIDSTVMYEFGYEDSDEKDEENIDLETDNSLEINGEYDDVPGDDTNGFFVSTYDNGVSPSFHYYIADELTSDKIDEVLSVINKHGF